MTVVATDLEEPLGPITPKLFPGEQSNQLALRLTGYLTRAGNDPRILGEPNASKHDHMTRALALHYAFSDVYIRMSSEPMTLSVTEKGSHGYNVEQIRNMRALADGYLAEMIAYLTVGATLGIRPGTVAVANKFGW